MNFAREESGELCRAKICLTVVDFAAGSGAADFLGATSFPGAFFVVVAFAIGLAVVVVVLDFLGCGASMSSSSSDVFLFVAVDFVTAADALVFLPLVCVAATLALAARFLVFGADLVCLTDLGAVGGGTRAFLPLGSSSDSSALRLLALGSVVVDWVVAKTSGDLRTRVEVRVDAGAAPALAAVLRGMLIGCAQCVGSRKSVY